jgi:hypothetical protein
MKIELDHVFDRVNWTVKKPFKTPDGVVMYDFEELYEKTKPIAHNRFTWYQLNSGNWIWSYREDALQDCAIVCMYVYAHTEGFEPYNSIYALMFKLYWKAIQAFVFLKIIRKKCRSLDAELDKDDDSGFTLLSLLLYFDKYSEFSLSDFLLPAERQLLKLVLAGYTLGEINSALGCNVLSSLYVIQKKVAKYFNVPYDPYFSRVSGMFKTILTEV